MLTGKQRQFCLFLDLYCSYLLHWVQLEPFRPVSADLFILFSLNQCCIHFNFRVDKAILQYLQPCLIICAHLKINSLHTQSLSTNLYLCNVLSCVRGMKNSARDYNFFIENPQDHPLADWFSGGACLIETQLVPQELFLGREWFLMKHTFCNIWRLNVFEFFCSSMVVFQFAIQS